MAVPAGVIYEKERMFYRKDEGVWQKIKVPHSIIFVPIFCRNWQNFRLSADYNTVYFAVTHIFTIFTANLNRYEQNYR